MNWVGFEPTIPVFDRAKTVHTLDRAATLIGIYLFTKYLCVYTRFHNAFNNSDYVVLDGNEMVSE
jgi:hypothetical protein